jgi:hypothetical protein
MEVLHGGIKKIHGLMFQLQKWNILNKKMWMEHGFLINKKKLCWIRIWDLET